MDKLNILIFYDDHACDTSTVIEHLDSFKKYSKHNIFFVIGTKGAKCDKDINFADVIIIHYSVRLSLPNYISIHAANEISNFKGLKLLFIQDEYENTHQAHYWIKKLGINTVFTCVPPEFIQNVYPKEIFPNVTFINNLTGYVPEDIINIDIVPPPEERKNFIVYRGRKLGYWYGSLGQEKYEIGIKMKKACKKAKIPEDIESEDEKRIYGSNWYNFLLSGRATLGTESGANIFDFDGTLKASIESYIKKNKKATYEEVAKIFLKNDGKILMNQISPKIFQAIMCRTALILYEGYYSGVVLPDKHYIPLRKDWSNVQEVIEKVKDLRYISELTENAYNDIIKSGKYNYQSLIRKVEDEISRHSLASQKMDVISIPILLRNNNGESKTLFKSSYIFSHYFDNRKLISKLIFPIQGIININKSVKVIDSTKSIVGYEFKKILNNNPREFYAAALSCVPLPHFIEFEFIQAVVLSKVEIMWFDEENFALDYVLEYWDEKQNKYIKLLESVEQFTELHCLNVNTDLKAVKNVRLVVYKMLGQSRILIRYIKFFSSTIISEPKIEYKVSMLLYRIINKIKNTLIKKRR